MIQSRSSSAVVHCPVCGSQRKRRVAELPHVGTVLDCQECGVHYAQYDSPENGGSAAPATTNDTDHFKGLDLDQYFRSVMQTRLRSYRPLLARLQPFVKAGKWLDIGCSYGWLLKFVAEQGFDAAGIEPSAAAAQEAVAKGLKMREGLFPSCLAPDEKFDVLSFMDVLEHLPSPIEALQSAAAHLNPGGIVVIQVPDQACFLYRLAVALNRYSGQRISFALRRLWLVGFDFPHQFYFEKDSLDRVVRAAGLQVLDWYRSPIGSPLEALDRVQYADPSSRLKNLVVGTAVGAINAVDMLTQHGGLLTMLARKEPLA